MSENISRKTRITYPEFSEYSKFMACCTSLFLKSKIKYDPMSVFLSSKINPVPYQIYDFNRLIQEYRKNGNIRTLIAYETGLGKTILVGMIIKELLGPRFKSVSGRKQRILILTPPTVLPQFQEEMKRKFDLNFSKFDTKNPHFSDMVIASIETLKLDPWKERLKNQTWDLIVVDEYHKVSQFNLRGELIQALTGKTKNFIALTATPHDGKSDRYGFRINSISPSPLIIRRTKKEAIGIDNKKLFDQNLHEITEKCEVSTEELLFYQSAEKYAKKRFEASGAGALVAIVIGRAVSSSVRAGVKLLSRRRKKLLLGDLVDNDLSSEFEDLFERVSDGVELSDDDLEKILSIQPQSRVELEEELSLLDPVLSIGENLIRKYPIDSKGKYLLELMDHLRSQGRKCLLYTGFLETVDYLKEILESQGHQPLEITGRVSMDERNIIVKNFTKKDDNIVIIGTDAMGESLNLQIASVEINYEVPWSPVSYIQRVGRIWRYGQKNKDLYIRNFLPAFDVERRVMEVILEKISIINEEFGDIGLSVFGEELGRVDELVKEAYSGEKISEKIENAYEKSVEIGKEVLEVLRSSMELPKVVNVEELTRNNIIDLDNTFSESDLLRFLGYLKDAGLAVGTFSEERNEQNTFHVKSKDYIRVEQLSLQDHGIQEAIKLAADLGPNFSFSFNFNKKMKGNLALFETKIDNQKVYEEPLLETSEGLLNYQGILGLAPSFTKKITVPTFIEFSKYESKTGKNWLSVFTSKWNDELRFNQNLLIKEKNNYKKEWLKSKLKDWLAKKPKNFSVSKKKEICKVNFIKAIENDAWRARYEVEMLGMNAAIEYYESKGYNVLDVSSQNRGYDVECRRADGILRVEVKGLRHMTYPLMTFNEYRMAQFYRDSFVLFILKVTGNKCSIFEIPDPINNIKILEIMKPVYQIKGFKPFKIEDGSTCEINKGKQLDFKTSQCPRTDDVVEMFKEISSFERQIRTFIFDKLNGHSVDLWKSTVIPKAIKKNWVSRKNDDLKEGRPQEQNPLNYADFSEYKDIIFYNWKQTFYSYFKDKEKLRVRLDDLNALCRRSTMHNRTISKDEMGLGKVSIRWLKARMKDPSDNNF